MIILKNGKKLPFFKVYSSVSEDSLADFLSLLPSAKDYYSDGGGRECTKIVGSKRLRPNQLKKPLHLILDSYIIRQSS